MRLKRIKLAGFKSFVDSTSIPFPGEMTAIVGPNGCGKSNVIDAVRWVLGESSAKNLRGDAMTDVIFSGSSARKPVSQCSVELIFDNSAGRIQGEFANYNEIAVKRVVTRDAQSSYWLNGTKCRRRDVTDIFLGTGLGPRSYAIIEQGMISRLIESKPQELRVFIEEAAGISKYKERRRETETRIRHTRENLERLDDVRSELNTQLDKLSRQAQAAQRYKALKATERDLKSELAALRWLGYSERANEIEQQITRAEADYQSLVTAQQSGEKILLEQRERQAELKQDIDDLQQRLFGIGTQITRLEQTKEYAEQRRKELDSEKVEQQQKLAKESIELNQLVEQCDAASLSVATLEPELEMLQEQVASAAESRDSAERKLTDFGREYKAQEQAHQQLKQQAQSCHSQIQSTMSMQLRTQQRISEIEQELASLGHETLVDERSALITQLHSAELEKNSAQEAHESVCSERSALEEQRVELLEYKQQALSLQQRYQAEIDALESLQDDLPDPVSSLVTDNNISQVWQHLSVDAGFETLIDRVAKTLNDAFVFDSLTQFSETDGNAQLPAVAIKQAWSTHKTKGSLAAHIQNEQVPNQLNDIMVAHSTQEALEMLPLLAAHQSVISHDGPWIGIDWVIQHQDIAQGKAARSARLAQCRAAYADAREKQDTVSEDIARLQRNIDDCRAQCQRCEQELDVSKQRYLDIQNRDAILTMQIEQQSERQGRLSEDLTEQKRLLAKEQQQLDALSSRVADVEERLLDFETEQLQYEQAREQCEKALAEARSQVDMHTSSYHQQALALQKQQNELARLNEKQAGLKALQTERSERLAKIEHEMEKLRLPSEQQQQEIGVLLAQRDDVSLRKTDKQNALSQIESQLSLAEQSQTKVAHDLQSRQTTIETLRLECEGFKVRASSMQEQLSETGQTLEAALERLSEDAQEKDWETKLESTKAAVARLGAVNLAAVEEFDVQSERKAHLDTQFDDLQSALGILEDAIRKIDRETKSRFSRTFDQVNDDLKTLFPKVFGGGSAYLALTGEDLLETGVTIMARPPGKKNTTIHLLSGGEKALTALSLVFAIFRLNPAPFCLLDEVDAPLDDANVGRFCRLVSEMSKSVQFIYITHNKIAMEMAEHLTGVTMSEPGVSRMVAVDVEAAVAIANA